MFCKVDLLLLLSMVCRKQAHNINQFALYWHIIFAPYFAPFQINQNKMKVNFFLKDKKANSSLVLIYVAYSGKRFKLSTGMTVNPSDWNSEKQMLIERRLPNRVNENGLNQFGGDNRQRIKAFNLTLTNIKIKVEKAYSDYLNSNDLTPPSHEVFKAILTGLIKPGEEKTENKPMTFYEFMEDFIMTAPYIISRKTKGNKPISELTIKQYKNLLKTLRRFEKEKSYQIDFNSINLTFHSDFLIYCNQDLMYSPEQIGKLIKNLKAICRRAKVRGFEIDDVVFHDDFFKPSIDNDMKLDVYVNWDEIKEIGELKLDGLIETVRDWFLIGLNTSLRISDLFKLTEDQVEGDFIRLTAYKTAQDLYIPIISYVKSIIAERGGFPPKVSEQDFNDYVKVICQMAGMTKEVHGRKSISVQVKDSEGRTSNVRRKIEGHYPKYELVSSHTCRRSFATNWYGVIPTPFIMVITGHRTEAEFLRYVRRPADENAKITKQLMENALKLKGIL